MKETEHITKDNKKLKYSLIEKNLPVNFEDFYLKTQTPTFARTAAG